MQRTLTVALVIPDITNPFYPVMARGVQDALADHGYHVVVCNTDGELDLERAFIADIAGRRLSGMILRSFHVELDDVRQALDMGIPTIALGRGFDHPLADSVSTNDAAGARTIVEHLISRGYRDIGYIGAFGETGVPREAGFRAALEDAGIRAEERWIAHADWTRDGGEEAMGTIFNAASKPSAVFCANDLMAIGAIHTARALGLTIPGDVAIAGYDDIDAASFVTPTLTTIANPAYEIGKSCAALLFERMTGLRDSPTTIVLEPGPLQVRESS
jgi:LacI family transcriptional regulator